VNRRFLKQPSSGPARVRHVLTSMVLLCSVLASPAAAAPIENHPELKVLLVLDRPSDPLMERIRAEIAALGLAVISRSPSGPLEADARAQHAVAAIRVLPSRKGVELWMADVTTGRTLARQLIVDEQAQGPDHTLIALQTAEILRTSLFPQPKKPPPPPPPPVVVEVVRPGPKASVEAGLGTLYSPGGAGAAFQTWLSVKKRWRSGFGVALDGSVPILRGSVSGIEGSAKVGGYLLCAGLFASFPTRESRWFLTTGISGGIIDVRANGEATWPLQPASSSVVTGAGYARVEAGWKPSSWSKLGFAGLAGTTFEHVTIRFAGNQAGTWGGIIFATFLQFGVEWE
jgi:hypothetical protein